MGTPAADLQFDTERVRALLHSQHPALARLPLELAASGWDNVLYRLGSSLALRLPRRAAAAKLIEHEQRWLPTLQQRLPFAVPVPLRVGVPEDWYPWCWSIVPWLPGETADLALPDGSQGAPLAAFFSALHAGAPADAPRNPYRGVPLQQRADKFSACLANLSAAGTVLQAPLLDMWETALAAPIDMPDTWIHGDLHPRNVLVRSGRICAVIDWGDLAAGDRACDLAALWWLLPERAAREAALAHCPSVSAHTWARARGWAVLMAVILLEAGRAGDVRMSVIARRTLERLAAGP